MVGSLIILAALVFVPGFARLGRWIGLVCLALAAVAWLFGDAKDAVTALGGAILCGLGCFGRSVWLGIRQPAPVPVRVRAAPRRWPA
jgi:hypothetical protein